MVVRVGILWVLAVRAAILSTPPSGDDPNLAPYPRRYDVARQGLCSERLSPRWSGRALAVREGGGEEYRELCHRLAR
jgi:hypothetical protein